MSTAAPTLTQPAAEGRDARESARFSGGIFERLDRLLKGVPLEDWITFGLIGLMLIAVGWSVQLADWGDLPSILPTLLLGWIAGFLASRSSIPLAAKISLAALVGFAVIMWQSSIPADGATVAERARDAWVRFWEWIAVARDGGVSNDSVPFAVMFMTASWITAYTITTLTFRVRNPWTPIVLLAVGLMSNLSFRPGLHEQTFYIFIIASIALFAHLTAVRRMDGWARNGVSFPHRLGWLSVTDGLLFGGIIVVIVLAFPIVEPRSATLDRIWALLKAPVDALEEPANRLLSGVKAGEGGGGLNLPDQVLTFQGEIELTEKPLAWMTSRYATMLPGRVYDRYDSNGWLATPQETRTVEARTELVPVPDDLGRERIEQLFQPLVDTNLVFPAGGVFSVDRDAEVEYLRPARYRIPLTGSVASLARLPDDVRQFAFDTRFSLSELAADSDDEPDTTLNNQPLMDEATVIETLREHLPPEIEVRLVEEGSGLIRELDITRIGPLEQVGVSFQEPVAAERLYTVTTFVQTASDGELQASSDDYPGWVEDRYLSLPDSLPVEVNQLSALIVRSAGATTPYEKVRAIQSFLQQQEYSLEIAGPEANQDGVYYFLFETQQEPCASDRPDCDASKIKGYSQYYGSAATVLMRAAGVPARMVAGWATGEYVPAAGRFLIRDQDRHGWSQAYFEGFGWVDVETTPGRVVIDRGQRFSVEPIGAGGLPDVGAIEDDPDLGPDTDPLGLSDLDDLARAAQEAALQRRLDELANQRRGIPWLLVAIPAVIAGGVLALFLAWLNWHRGMTPAEQAYTKMVRAGRLLGFKRKHWQTPTEFADTVGDLAPGVANSAMLIASEFERKRYGSPGYTDTQDGLPGHWRKVLRGMLGYRIRVVGGAGPELGEGRRT